MQIKVNLRIFLFIAIFVLTHQIEIYTCIMIFSLVHELGHMIAGILLKLKPKSLNFCNNSCCVKTIKSSLKSPKAYAKYFKFLF